MSKKIVGIIGGIGPYAGLDLVDKIFKNTIAHKDIDHIPLVLVSIPELIADRTDFILKRSQVNPAEGIKKALDQLTHSGVEIAAIACNAAHSEPIFKTAQSYAQKLGIELVSIIDATVKYLQQLDSVKRTAVFSVMATYHSQVYEKALHKAAIDTYTIDEQMAESIHHVVRNDSWGIKAQSSPVTEKARLELVKNIQHLESAGVDSLILGCTELPLAVSESTIEGIQIIDPTLITARAIIEKVAPHQLKSLSES